MPKSLARPILSLDLLPWLDARDCVQLLHALARLPERLACHLGASIA